MKTTYKYLCNTIEVTETDIHFNSVKVNIDVGVWPNVILTNGMTINATSGKSAVVTLDGKTNIYHRLNDNVDSWRMFRVSKRTLVYINESSSKIYIDDEYVITSSYIVGKRNAYVCEKGTLVVGDTSTWNGIATMPPVLVEKIPNC